jgi:hypothetical protein
MRKGLILSVLLMNVVTFGFSQTAAWTVNNVGTWIEAVNGIRSGGNDKEYTITVTSTVSVPASTESTFGDVTGITVTIEGSGTITLSNNGVLLQVGTGQTVVAKDITLQGRTNNNAPVVRINSGTFRMEGNAKVSGNTGNGVTIESNYGGNSTFIMDGGTISGNTGNGVFLHAEGRKTFTMGGGTISNNSADNGGGVYQSGGTFAMQGDASISGNTAVFYGGGVYYGGTHTKRYRVLA